MATGRYVAMLDHDDMLEPDALARVAAVIASDPGVEMLYSDEDIVLDGKRLWSHLKPGLVAGDDLHQRVHLPHRRLSPDTDARTRRAPRRTSTVLRITTSCYGRVSG